MNIISDKQQDNILSKSLKKIKAQTYTINNTISQNNLRQCLKGTYTLLNELRINTLTPKRYSNLYISIIDIMLTIKNYFSEIVLRNGTHTPQGGKARFWAIDLDRLTQFLFCKFPIIFKKWPDFSAKTA